MLSEFPAALAIGATTLAFLIFWVLTKLTQLDTIIGDNRKQVFYMRSMGMLCFVLAGIGVVLLSPHPWAFWGWKVNQPLENLRWPLYLLLPVVAFNFFGTQRAANLAQYPQVRHPVWTPGLLLSSALTWAGYLLAYEWLFRGVLLPYCLQEMSVSAAVAINLALYSLVHLPKGLPEVFAALPFGLLVCWLSIETKCIWPAFILHLMLAWSNEWFSLFRHPALKFRG